jgi:hypothetical protein
MAIYNRLTLVITVKEELLHPRRETNERAAWYEVRESHIAIADSDGTWLLGVGLNCACKTTETRGLLSSSSSDRFGSNNTARKPEPLDVERVGHNSATRAGCVVLKFRRGWQLSS